MDIIDIHAHIFPSKIVKKAVDSIGSFYDLPMHGAGTADDLLENGCKINARYFAVHSVATNPAQVMSINDYISQEMKLNPQFIGFATLHPFMSNPEAEVDRVIKLGLKGVKLHPDFQRFDIDCEAALDLYAIINGRLPILMHIGDKRMEYSHPKKLASVASRFPNQIFIAAHLGGYTAWDEAEKYIIGRNFFIDTSSSLFFLDKNRAAEIIRAHGADRVLFGTDYPMWLHGEEYERFMQLPLSDAEREKILGLNAAKLLKLSPQ